MAEHKILPQSKTRDLIAIWTEFNQLALKYGGINFCHGVPGMAPPEFLTKALQEAVGTNMNNHYTAVQGHPLLRQEIAKHFSPLFNNRPLNMNTDVLVTNGAIGAIYAVIMNCVGKGDEVIMFEPYYTQYINHIEFAGADVQTAKMFTNEQGLWSFDFDHFESILNEKSKLLIITNPHNPSGKIFTKEEIARLSAILEKWPQVTVLSDDVYFHLPFDHHEHVSFANYSETNWNKTVNIFSAGKLLNCTGWKIGWAIGPKDLIAQAFAVHEASSFNTNVPGQVAIANCLDEALNKEYEGHKNYLVYTAKVFQQGRDAAVEMLKLSQKIKFRPTHVESGYFMPIDVTGCEDQIPAKYFVPNVNYETDPDTIVRQMQFPANFEKVPLDFALARYLAVEKGISLMPVSNFCLHESKAPHHNYVRMAICKHPEVFTDPVLVEKFKNL